MQIIVTDSRMARTRVLHFARWQLVAAGLGVVLLLLAVSGAAYHYIFLQAAREGWPVVAGIVRWVVRDDIAERDRFMRQNLDAMATRLGEMQAELIRLQLVSERAAGLAGIKPEDLRAPAVPASGAQGGPYRGSAYRGFDDLGRALAAMDESAALTADVFTLVESRLLESRLDALMVPSSRPLEGPVGSGFGFRNDPITHRTALHTGLDFPAPVGTPIRTAAGGVVASAEQHPEYGLLVVIDHGRGLTTRYAHTSSILVHVGDIVRRQQAVALVGTSGRSTGPHLHFEVLVDGVPQNPARFLAGRVAPPLQPGPRESPRKGR